MEAREPIDYDGLEAFLRALASSSRLELVTVLQEPQALNDIHLTPRQVRAGENADRRMARQTLKAHLDKLVDVGLVLQHGPQGAGRGTTYAWNPQRFYQILEEFRKVGTPVPDAVVPRDATLELGAPAAPVMAPGPKLMLVQGLMPGQVFPLDPARLEDGRGWIVGRKPDVHVSLAYDPFVSLENAEILPAEADGPTLLDLRSSKNGTWLNWRRLDRGAEASLVAGDVIGVGRSALVFRDD